ncbi:MAG: AP2 domain-containing protein [Nanoarchaeota archaeon]
MNKIELSGKNGIGKFILVDDENFDWLNQWSWFLVGRNLDYVCRRTHIGSAKNGTRKSVGFYIHRLIMDAPKDLQVDHRNRNKLDNRRKNLRFCNNSQNHQNQGISKKNTSGYKGVNYIKSKWRVKRWRAQIRVNGKNLTIASFNTKEEAALAYNQAAQKYFGEYARLNFVY